jgi:hypothetical protein
LRLVITTFILERPPSCLRREQVEYRTIYLVAVIYHNYYLASISEECHRWDGFLGAFGGEPWRADATYPGSLRGYIRPGEEDRFLVCANYSSGTVAVLPINPDGSLGALSDLVTLEGKPGPHGTEQASAHPHDVAFDPRGRFFIVPDKGLDAVFVFRVDPATGKLLAAAPASAPADRARGRGTPTSIRPSRTPMSSTNSTPR